MIDIDGDLERLALLLADVKARATRPGQPPYAGFQELGKFVEEVSLAIGRTFGSEPGIQIQVSEWHVELPKHGYSSHPSEFGPLHTIYGYRNMASHANEAMHELRFDDLLRAIADVFRLVPKIVTRLTRHSLVDSLFAVQACSWQQARAEHLIAAIGDAETTRAAVMAFCLPYIPERRRGFLKAPAERHVRRAVSELAALTSSADADPIKGLADHLSKQSPPIENVDLIREWRIRYGNPLSARGEPARIPLLHVVVERDPRAEHGLLIRDVIVVEPPVAFSGVITGRGGIVDDQLSHLPEVLTKIINDIATRLRGVEDADRLRWADFVLELEVPSDLACLDFECAEARPGRSLTNTFRCVTLRPSFDYEPLAPLHGVRDAVAHPRHGRNATATWRVSESTQLHQAAQGFDCLFAGDSAWSCENTPPIVESFEGYPAAVVCSGDDESALDPIFGTDDEVEWSVILDRIARLRKNGQRLKVLWNDPDYAPFVAESL